jgi:hypothetical protein
MVARAVDLLTNRLPVMGGWVDGEIIFALFP